MRAAFVLYFLLTLSACAPPSSQQTIQQERLSVENAWAAPTPAGVEVSAGYLTIDNATAAVDRLLRATSPRAERVEVHEMIMDGSVMRMRPAETVEIEAGESVVLAPGGMHLMFYGVAQPFAEGEEIPVQLTFATAGDIDVVLPVRRSAPENHAAH